MRRFTGLAAIAAVLLVPATGIAQDPVRVQEDPDCHAADRGDRYCEIREFELPARSSLEVDAGPNGGIRVTGWDRDDVRLIARVQATSRNGDPRDLVRSVEIRTGNVIDASGPRGSRSSWAVSYELWVPRSTSLLLAAHNGGIRLDSLEGDVAARTTNGGIHLSGGAGRVRGETTNGGLHLELVGPRWEGDGVDLRTTNGGVQIRVPDGYAADLETGTVNGGMSLDIPITVQGPIGRTLRTELGGGGALIRAMTTNGGVSIRGG